MADGKNVSRDAMKIHAKIADRFVGLCNERGVEAPDRMELLMSLFYCEDCERNLRIDWEKMMNADNFNFAHDVSGIHRHASRTEVKLNDGTLAPIGYLTGFFLPRFTKSVG